MNCPISLPIAISMFDTVGSGPSARRVKNSSTPKKSWPLGTGKARPQRRPALAARSWRLKFCSCAKSVIQTGCRSCHARPGRLSPGLKLIRRPSSTKNFIGAECSRSVIIEAWSNFLFRSGIQNAPMSISKLSSKTWTMPGVASSSEGALARMRVIACSAARRTSARLRSVMSEAEATQPFTFPKASFSGVTWTSTSIDSPLRRR